MTTGYRQPGRLTDNPVASALNNRTRACTGSASPSRQQAALARPHRKLWFQSRRCGTLAFLLYCSKPALFTMEVSCLALPALAKVVVADLARREIADRGKTPAGEMDSQAGRFAAEETECAVDRIGKMPTPGSGKGRFGVFDLGFDVDDVRHGFLSTLRGGWCQSGQPVMPSAGKSTETPPGGSQGLLSKERPPVRDGATCQQRAILGLLAGSKFPGNGSPDLAVRRLGKLENLGVL